MGRIFNWNTFIFKKSLFNKDFGNSEMIYVAMKLPAVWLMHSSHRHVGTAVGVVITVFLSLTN
jgi:hypothetical protein